MYKNEMQYAKMYLLGTMTQILIVCLISYILSSNSILYPKAWNTIFMIIGGTSSALWGIIISLKAKRVKSIPKLIKEFFHIKQSVLYYGMVLLFVMIIFGEQLFDFRLVDDLRWYSFFIYFVIAIVFGGIEEIGWRYTFQPLVEKKANFEIACIVTFVSWCTWHYMYFYITNSLHNIQHISFIIGLLGSCFVLGAIYYISNSLWVCVLYHCLLNMFSQTMLPNDLSKVIIYNIIAIIVAIFIVRFKKHQEQTD